MSKTATQRSKEYGGIKLDWALCGTQKEKERKEWKVRAAKMKKAVRTTVEEKEKQTGGQTKKRTIFLQKIHPQVIRTLQLYEKHFFKQIRA